MYIWPRPKTKCSRLLLNPLRVPRSPASVLINFVHGAYAKRSKRKIRACPNKQNVIFVVLLFGGTSPGQNAPNIQKKYGAYNNSTDLICGRDLARDLAGPKRASHSLKNDTHLC